MKKKELKRRIKRLEEDVNCLYSRVRKLYAQLPAKEVEYKRFNQIPISDTHVSAKEILDSINGSSGKS